MLNQWFNFHLTAFQTKTKLTQSLIWFQLSYQQNNIVYCAGKLKALAIILLLKLRKESISMHTLIPLYFVNDPKYDQIEDFKFKK